MKRSFILNQKWYISVDKTGRINVPSIFLSPDERKVYKAYYVGNNKIYFEAEKDSPIINNIRLVIPKSIRELIGIQPDDLFELNHYNKGFILEKVEKESLK